MAVMTGWNGEAFARTKRLKPLPEYLKPAPDEGTRQANGAAAVLALFRRAQAKQEKRVGDG